MPWYDVFELKKKDTKELTFQEQEALIEYARKQEQKELKIKQQLLSAEASRLVRDYRRGKHYGFISCTPEVEEYIYTSSNSIFSSDVKTGLCNYIVRRMVPDDIGLRAPMDYWIPKMLESDL